MRVARRGLHVSYWLDLPCKVKSNRFAVTRGYENLDLSARSLLFQASMPPTYWVEALHAATHVLNILPTKTLQLSTPHFALFGTAPTYGHLRVFGCLCYPNLSATTAHKLAPRSAS